MWGNMHTYMYNTHIRQGWRQQQKSVGGGGGGGGKVLTDLLTIQATSIK